MRKILLSVLAALVAATLAIPASAAGPTRATAPKALSPATDYVVVYAPDASPRAARATIKAAGGSIVKELPQIGVAIVKATNSGFSKSVASGAAVLGAARNRPIGFAPQTARPSRAEIEWLLSERAKARGKASATASLARANRRAPRQEPLAALQWDMRAIDATPNGSYRVQQGRRGVTVGIMDTGVDGSHPDIAPNFSRRLSANFVTDIPLVDGPCEVPSCVDPADVDGNGHGTHVAGIVAAAKNQLGTAGVAPKVTVVNVRAGQDSGFFFLGPTLSAIVYSGAVGIDVINMSFFVDPWLFNCTDNPADSPAAQREQQLTRIASQRALDFARDMGTTAVAALGNGHTDLGNPTTDEQSPNFPPGSNYHRDVDNSCITVPSESEGVISVASIGPSGRKSYFSDYGVEQNDVSAPGGDFRDFFGTQQYRTPGNLVLSAYPEAIARERGDLNPDGTPNNPFVIRDCRDDTCAYYQYLQGTSMASPHAVGVASLIVSEFGKRDRARGGLTLSPRRVERILRDTATDTPCPVPAFFDYPDPELPAEFDATCEGSLDDNGFYGDGIVNAFSAVIH